MTENYFTVICEVCSTLWAEKGKCRNLIYGNSKGLFIGENQGGEMLYGTCL